MTETRKTPRGREKPAPRITPTYGTARQRKATRQREALERLEVAKNQMKAWEARNVQ